MGIRPVKSPLPLSLEVKCWGHSPNWNNYGKDGGLNKYGK